MWRIADKADPIKSLAEIRTGNNNRAGQSGGGFVIVEVPPPGKVRKTSSESRYSKAGIKGTIVYSTRAPAFTIMSRFGSGPAPDIVSSGTVQWWAAVLTVAGTCSHSLVTPGEGARGPAT